jgi:hypothetical protein
MAMDPKKRMALEAKIQDHRTRTRIPHGSVLNAKIREYVAVQVERHGEDIYLSAIEEGPTRVDGLKLNAVAAMQMAADVLEAVKDLFPDTLTIETIRTLPKGELH